MNLHFSEKSFFSFSFFFFKEEEEEEEREMTTRLPAIDSSLLEFDIMLVEDHYDQTGRILYTSTGCKTPTEYAVTCGNIVYLQRYLEKYNNVQMAYDYFMDIYLTKKHISRLYKIIIQVIIKYGGDCEKYLESRPHLTEDERRQIRLVDTVRNEKIQ